MKEIDITGVRFGRLVAIKKTQKGSQKAGCKRTRAKWLCQCDCGKQTEVVAESLHSGNTKSCGCLSRENVRTVNKTHGMSKTRLYGIWHSMKMRCENENAQAYDSYGGRGVTVCERWSNSFEAFFNDMGSEYHEGLTLDRIDNDKGYYPENCRWVSMKTQCNNRRSSVSITRNGETKTIAEWCRHFGIKQSTVTNRRYMGWDEEKLFDPPHKKERIIS